MPAKALDPWVYPLSHEVSAFPSQWAICDRERMEVWGAGEGKWGTDGRPVEVLGSGKVPAPHTPSSLVKDLLLKVSKEILVGVTPEATASFLSSLEVTLV